MKYATTAFALLLIAAMLVYAAPAPPGGPDCLDCPDCPDRIAPVMKVQIRAIENDSAMIPVIIILKHAEQMQSGRAAQMGASSTSGRLGVLNGLDDDHGTSDVRDLWLVNGVAMRASRSAIEAISRRDDVERIELDRILQLPDAPASRAVAGSPAWGVSRINAVDAWDIGINGSGINVSIIDSGICADHADLDDLDDNGATDDPKILKWIDYVNVSKLDPYDDCGHGTHVAGTVSGTGAGGTQTGVAPGTNLLVAKVFDSAGDAYLSDVILAFQWSIENGADVISFSGGGIEHDQDVTVAIDNIVAAGVVPVIAAGNDGPGASTINCPGSEKGALTVGSINIADDVASSSSRGPVTIPGNTWTKPDVAAPGVNIISTYNNGGYYVKSGTSMATPHVSGTVALMLQVNSSLTPDEIKSILENTAVDLGSPGKDNDTGAGRINAYQAVLASDTTPPAVIANSPIGAWVRNGTVLHLNATITDSGLGVRNASVDVAGVNSTIATAFLSKTAGDCQTSDSIIVDTACSGLWNLTIVAYDNASNANNSVNMTVIVDNTPPAASGKTPAGTTYANNATPTIGVMITDNKGGSGVNGSSITMTVDGTPIDISLTEVTGGFYATNRTVNECSERETVNVTVNASDILGNAMTCDWSFVIDLTEPVVDYATANPGTIEATGEDNALLNVTATDAISGIANVTVNLTVIGGSQSQEMTNVSCVWQFTVNATAIGDVVLSVNVTDAAGNSNTSATIALAVVPPTVTTSVNTTANVTTQIDAMSKTGTTIDLVTGSNVTYCEMVVSTAPAASDLGSGALNMTSGLADGEHAISKYIRINASDNLLTNLSWAVIRIYYTVDDLDQNDDGDPSDAGTDIGESGLCIYWYNRSGEGWIKLVTGLNLSGFGGPVVFGADVNTTDTDSYAGCVRANVSNFSIYGLGGCALPTPSPPPDGNSGSSSGGGCSGGGGGASGEAYANIALRERVERQIMKDRFITYRFVKPGTDITFVNFTARNNYGSVAAVVEMLHNTSTLIAAAPPGTVYKNINLWVGSAGFATDVNMENVTVSFRVNRSWIDGNSVSISKIRLHGYNKSDKTWMLLPIEITGKDESHIHFESKTAIFNQLAITCPAPVSNSMSAPAQSPSRFGASAHVPEETLPTSHTATPSRRANASASAASASSSSIPGPGIASVAAAVGSAALLAWKMRTW
ncbi:MAG: S8 family serine peptidase [Euryarchaeota archaeon]|nr:S8 family serine peptidase [Euryarchaeota archaeon]